MHPLLRLLIPSSAGRNDMQMRVVLAIAAMRLDHDDVATLERLPTHRAQEIISALDTTLHEGTEQRVCVLIKRGSEAIRHGQDNMPIHNAVREHLADLADPVIARDLGTA